MSRREAWGKYFVSKHVRIGALAAIAFVSALGHSGTARAEDEKELWLWAALDIELVDDLELQWDQQFRILEDVKDPRYQNQLGLEYEVVDWLKLRVAHRLYYDAYKDDREDRCCRNRIHGDAKFGDKIGKIKPDARTRLQSRFEKGEDPVTVFRLRLQLKLRVWKKVRPYAAVEGFVTVLEQGGPTPRTLRATVGSQFRIKKPGRLKAYYRFEIPHDVTDPLVHIFGFGGTFKVRR